MWHRRWMIARRLLRIVLVLTVLLLRGATVSAAVDGTSDLTVAQCVLTLGSYDANADQRINRTEFAQVVQERCSSSAEAAIWETVFLDAACLCREYDGNNASSSDDCCSVNPVIRRPGQYAKEYTIAVCSFLYDQFAQHNCSSTSNISNATETPTAAPLSLIVATTDVPLIQSPTMAPSLSTGNVAVVDNNTTVDNDESSLAPGMLALLVLLAATSTVLVLLAVPRFSRCSLSPSSSSSNGSQARTVAKGSVLIHKSSRNDDETKKKKQKVVVVLVNDPTSFSTSSFDQKDDEERALPPKESASTTRSSASKATTPPKNYYVDTDHDLMYASHQYFSAPTTTSPAERDRSNPSPEHEDDEEDNVILEDGSSSSSSSSSDSYLYNVTHSSSSSSSSTSSQGDPSSVAALLSDPLPMSVLYGDASLATEPHRRPSTIQTTIFEDRSSDPLAPSLPDPAGNPGVTMGRSLASGAATRHISPSLPDYGIVQFTEFPSAPDVDVDEQTVLVSNRPPSRSQLFEDCGSTENAPSVPDHISQPIRTGRTVSKQRTRPLPARV
jgi:hypothetical protein